VKTEQEITNELTTEVLRLGAAVLNHRAQEDAYRKRIGELESELAVARSTAAAKAAELSPEKLAERIAKLEGRAVPRPDLHDGVTGIGPIWTKDGE
jgi:hypothetical protein